MVHRLKARSKDTIKIYSTKIVLATGLLVYFRRIDLSLKRNGEKGIVLDLGDFLV